MRFAVGESRRRSVIQFNVLRPTISISFLNHVLFPQVSDHHLRIRLLEQRHHFAMTEDVEFHVLELPKFNKTLDQLVRAVEELTMLTQTDIERERYKSRRKAQMDYVSAMNAARQEGEAMGQASGEQIGAKTGKQIGKLVGAVQAYQRMLKLPLTPDVQLLSMSLEDLGRMADDLEKLALNQC